MRAPYEYERSWARVALLLFLGGLVVAALYPLPPPRPRPPPTADGLLLVWEVMNRP
jgi:hypothetical protein